jgi:response regulator of citrate/malate metabolism
MQASIEKSDILIIEDSIAVCVLISEFLKKLGYQNIHSCNTGQAGIDKFEELAKAGRMPIVLLDFNLPDITGDNVLVGIFRMRPDAKVIIETASEKDDTGIKNAISSGAYQYLQKPIRFENIKNIMNVLEEENKILNGTTEIKTEEMSEKILSLLQSSMRISLAWISEYCNLKREETMNYLKELISKGKASKLEDIKEISCSNCGSVKIGQTFHCPSCNSHNFKHGSLIEHYHCGNFSEEASYKDNMCPKCRKEIKILGVDYRLLKNYYSCHDCSNKFSEPTNDYLCLKCNSKFKLDDAKWITTEGFRATT